tara:strand:+ start:4173 stop:4382 length:210 start_codon:yes stop_codon:yes gene_type:complete
MKNQGAWLLVGAVAIWWMWKNNGWGFIPTQASGEFRGNPYPSSSGGDAYKVNGVYDGNPVQTISGTWHL